MSTIPTIMPDELQRLKQSGENLRVIDVRSPSEYRSGHIQGAQSVPLEDVQTGRISALTSRLDRYPNETLYVTCHSGTRARQAAEQLAAYGIRNVALLEGGTQAWEEAGLPMKRCGNAISLERQVQVTIGSLLVLKVIFGFTVHELFFVLSALIGSGLIVAGLTRWCGMARLIAKMPWNRSGDCTEEAAV